VRYLAGLLACRTVLLGTLLCRVRTDGWHRPRVDRHWRCQQWPTGSRHRYRLKPLRHCRRKHLSRRCRLQGRQNFQVPVEVPTICRPALVGPALRRAVMVSTGKPRSAYCGAQFAVRGCSEEITLKTRSEKQMVQQPNTFSLRSSKDGIRNTCKDGSPTDQAFQLHRRQCNSAAYLKEYEH
jgi:hypothetical protein